MASITTDVLSLGASQNGLSRAADDTVVQELQGLLERLRPSSEEARSDSEQLEILQQASAILEEAAENFERITDDPYATSLVSRHWTAQDNLARSQHTVGRLATTLHSSGAVGALATFWGASTQVQGAHLTAATRFLLAAVNTIGFQADDLEDYSHQLMHSAFQWGPSTQADGSSDVAIQCYVTGMVAAMLTSTGYCEEAVGGGHSEPLMTHLRDAVAVLEARAASAEAARGMQNAESSVCQGRMPPARENLEAKLLRHWIRCAVSLGPYLDFVPPLLSAGGAGFVLRLIRVVAHEPKTLFCALQWLASLLVHRKIADAFVDEGGIEALLALPRGGFPAAGLAAVLAELAPVPSALQKAAKRPFSERVRLLAMGFELETSSVDGVRKHAAVFLAAVLAKPDLSAAFKAAGGLRCSITALARSLLILRTAPENHTEREICSALCCTLSLYFNARLAQQLHPGQVAAPMSGEGLEACLAALPAESSDDSRASWAFVKDFVLLRGPAFMLDVLKLPPCERHSAGMAWHALRVLGVVTLTAGGREALIACSQSASDLADRWADTLLSAACGTTFRSDEEVQVAALQVVVNCVSSADSSERTGILHGRGADLQMRAAFRAAGATRAMVLLLEKTEAGAIKHCALAAQILIGLAHDMDTRCLLSKLQVSSRLAELLSKMQPPATSHQSQALRCWEANFRAAAAKLISIASPGVGVIGTDSIAEIAVAPMLRLERAAVAAVSHVTYEPQELLCLIRDHLEAAGLEQTAGMLAAEAGLADSAAAAAPRGCTDAVQGIFLPPSRLPPKPEDPPVLQNQTGKEAMKSRLVIKLSGRKRGQSLELPPIPHPSIRSRRQGPLLSQPLSQPRPAQAANGWAASSRLDAIMLDYLRQQHRAACLTSSQPVSTLPTLSLLSSNPVPEACHGLTASSNASRRLLDRQILPGGGLFGRKQSRHFVYSRFRHRKSFRAAEAGEGLGFTSCRFLEGGQLLLGGQSGSLRLCQDSCGGDSSEDYYAHSSAVLRLRAHEANGLLLSSSRGSVKLWRAPGLGLTGVCAASPILRHAFPQWRGGVLSQQGWSAGMASCRTPSAQIIDVATCRPLLTISEPGECMREARDLCFNASGELLLWGPALWDPRGPTRVHRFDVLSHNWGSCAFHPAGMEAIVDGQVWDLRTLRLRRNIPMLEGTSLAFNAVGDVAFAGLRRVAESSTWGPEGSRRHPLRSALLVMDSTDYSEISRLELDGRHPLDWAVSPQDECLATCLKLDTRKSGVRLYDIGRPAVQGDESDGESEAEEEDSSDEELAEEDEADDPSMRSDYPHRYAREQRSEERDVGMDDAATGSETSSVETSSSDEEDGSSSRRGVDDDSSTGQEETAHRAEEGGEADWPDDSSEVSRAS